MAKRISPTDIEVVSSAETLRFVRDLQKDFANKPRTPKLRRRMRERLAKAGDEKLVGIGFRILADLLRPPQEEPRRRKTKPSKP
jgi:hypothetical protein